MGTELASFESNEALLSRLPKFPVGFRGQAAEFNEKTLLSGFDRPREYFVINLRKLSLNDIRMQWSELREQFNFSVKWGRTDNQQSIRNNMSVSEVIAYYKEHPAEFSSILVLTFPRLTDWPLSHIKSKYWYYAWYKHKLPPKNIAGVIHSQREDFLEFEDQLARDLSLGKDFERLHQHIKSKMMTRYLEFLVGSNVIR